MKGSFEFSVLSLELRGVTRVGRLVLIATVLIAASGSAQGIGAGQGQAVQFDAIIELNAPLAGTNVALFARYWVSADSHRAAVVWGEPHTGALNFPTYPPSLNIVSEPNQFILNHQLHSLYNRAFAKPTGKLGPFRDKFNSYDLSGIRFAEKEALDLRGLAGKQGPAGAVRQDEISVFGKDGGLLESIKNEYGGDANYSLLLRQQVFLPERPIIVGFTGQGPTVRIGSEERQYSEFETVHHEGGRRCVVEYAQQAIGGRSISLPSRIAVYSGDGKRLLRSARLYSFVECRADQVETDAKRFSGFDSDEIACRQLLLKDWMKPAREVSQSDVQTLHEIRDRFLARDMSKVSVGERLKRINMLAEIDLMLGDKDHLSKCFAEYLSLLRTNDLNTMPLVGGLSRIDITMRWNQFDAADRLMGQWLEATVGSDDPSVILAFADTQIRKGQCWATARLLERSLQSQDWGEHRFAGQVLRCAALEKLREGFAKSEELLKTEQAKTQAGWVASSFGIENVTQALCAGIGEAQRTFAHIEQPAKREVALKRQLDGIEKMLAGSEPRPGQ